MKIKELLADPNSWCKGSYAEDERGLKTNPCDGKAAKWCLAGACAKCYESCSGSAMIFYGDMYNLLHQTIIKRYGTSVAEYNDHHTHDEVLALVEELDI